VKGIGKGDARVTKSGIAAAWLATPFVVWAGAFLSGWFGAWLGETVTWLIVGGLIGGLASVVGWSAFILRMRNRLVRIESKLPEENSDS